MIREAESLEYHQGDRPGKIEVASTKPCVTQRDLSLAYTPGVAFPCLRIHDNPDDVYRYTAKGNLVAVVSNGTAVLGLGDIGAAAGKPVMEGKGVLFKRFADIDVFDIELDTHDPEEIIRCVELMAPTFGGINLEDIKGPQCFRVEEELKRRLDIPVFHDDQHGTAIISGAALLNALEVAGKRIEDVRVVFNGAGASGIACARYYKSLGVRAEHLILCDSKGPIHRGRDEGMNPQKEEFAVDTSARTLAEAMRDADVFVGLSVAGCVTPDMVRSMAPRPIVFAMANPDPEIGYEEAKAARTDVLMATGRSDYPNQVNNVLGFPFIFRGALDVRAKAINEEMKLAATRALAALAKEDVPESVTRAYGLERLQFGPEYLIPKPFDYRVLLWESAAVARAAMETGVARTTIDLDEYADRLEARLGKSREIVRFVIREARRAPRRVVFPEGTHPKVLRAAEAILDERFARPVLLGKADVVRRTAADLGLELDGVDIIDPAASERMDGYVERFFRARQRKGVTLAEARQTMARPTYFAAMMVDTGDADAMVAGIAKHYPDTIRPALQIIGTREDVTLVAGLYPLVLRGQVYCFADPLVNIDPTAENLAEIAMLSAEQVRRFHVEPKVAMISFSNFGSVRHPKTDKVRRATEIVRERAPGIMVDGEMQADTALVEALRHEHYPFSTLVGSANVLVFPDLQSANAAYKLVLHLAPAEALGPILMGMRKPVQVLQHGADVKDIVSAAALAVLDAGSAAPVEARESVASVSG